MVVRRLLPLLLLVLLTACQKELDQIGGGEVRLSYTLPDDDGFPASIDTMRWLLYDGSGDLVRELHLAPRQQQFFTVAQLPEGTYTVVNVSNAKGRTAFCDKETLDGLSLAADTQTPEGWYENTDHLFWQMKTFSLEDGHQTADLPLVDVHCHLHVHVGWKGLPRQQGSDWTMRLYGVPLRLWGGRQGLTLSSGLHPQTDDTATGEHRIQVRMLNYELEGVFTTFRWTDACVPALQIWCGEEPASPLMRLATAFNEWHWSPDHTVAQDYWLDVMINPDGTADVKASSRFGVVDWIDGGTIIG